MMRNRMTAVRAACLGGAAAIGLAAFSAPASAQSLEELRRQIEILTQRIEQLEAEQRARPQGAAPASTEGLVESGEDDIRLTLSGQVNRGVLFADNGDDSEVFHVDNDIVALGAGNFDLPHRIDKARIGFAQWLVAHDPPSTRPVWLTHL